MNFTDSPFEKMMKQVPRPPRPGPARRPPRGSPCRKCRFWSGSVCIGVCYRDLLISPKEERKTSGQVDPMSQKV